MINGSINGSATSVTDNLVMFGTGTELMTKFVSFETASMQGTNWELTGTGAFTTSATVQSGLLRVNGTLTSPAFAVLSGGTLGGTGTIVGAVTNAGIVAPGNSIGTLNITGPYTQATGSSLNVEVSTAPASDLLNITGTATIQGGTSVNVFAAPGLYTVGQRYTILTALGGVGGTYTTLTDNAPFVDFTLAYDPNNVYLDVLRSSVTFAQLAQTPNQRAAAGGTQALGAGNSVFDAVVMLDAANALRAFDLSVRRNPRQRQRHADGGKPLRARIDHGSRCGNSSAASLRSLRRRSPAINYADDEDDDALSYAEKTQEGGSVRSDRQGDGTASRSAGNLHGLGARFRQLGQDERRRQRRGARPRHRRFRHRYRPRFWLIRQSVALRPGRRLSAFIRAMSAIARRPPRSTLITSPLTARRNTTRSRCASARRRPGTRSTPRARISFPGFADVAKAGYSARTTQIFGEAGYGFIWGGSPPSPSPRSLMCT